MFDFGYLPEQVTEAQWESFFVEANTKTVKNYVIVDEAMKSLRMDTSLKEAQSRMSRLQNDLYKVLEAHNLSEEMFTEAPRLVIGCLVDALEPAEIVRHPLTLETNKETNWLFCKWVTSTLVQYMQWNDIERAQKESSTSGSKSNLKQSVCTSGRFSRGPVTADASPGTSMGTSTTNGNSEGTCSPNNRRPALPCLKCHSPDHLTRDCPQIAPGEAAM